MFPIEMNYNGVKLFGQQRIQAIVSHLKSCFITSNFDFSSELSTLADQTLDIYHQQYSDRHSNLWDDFNGYFDTSEIKNAIQKLDEKKDDGPMGIASRFIKYNSDILAPIFEVIFNNVMCTGTVPALWKCSFITPIPKHGSLSEVTNYRGIAMQSVIPIFFDKLITDKLYHHVEKLIPHTQHGFMRKRGTTTNLLEITQYLHDNLKHNQIDVVYFDFSKAFDQVDHFILATRLAKLSMPYSFFKVIISFITGRSYQLKANGVVYSDTFSTKSSVPQGSHCGPLLFLLLSADIVECVRNTGVNVLQYADDTKFYRIVNSEDDRMKMQVAIDNLKRWAELNRLQLNGTKTVHVSFVTRVSNNFNSIYHIESERITKKDQMRDLGVIFDSKLTFIPHVKDVIMRANRAFGIAYRFQRELHAPKLMSKLMSVYITPIMEYCSIIWARKNITIEDELDKILNRSTMIALRIGGRLHPNYIESTERLKKLNLISFRHRRIISSVVTIFKIARGLTHSRLVQFVRSHMIVADRSTRSPNCFNITRDVTQYSPLYMAMEYANRYRHCFDTNDSPIVIKNKLTNYFFSQL